jgi:hypothetical protein
VVQVSGAQEGSGGSGSKKTGRSNNRRRAERRGEKGLKRVGSNR